MDVQTQVHLSGVSEDESIERNAEESDADGGAMDVVMPGSSGLEADEPIMDPDEESGV